MDEVVKEFLIESSENLSQLDLDLVELERDRDSAELLGRIFRAFHTIKGVAGFLNFAKLEALTHAAEGLLSRLRDRELILDSSIASALLNSVDAVRRMLASVESNGTDGEFDYADLIRSLAALTEGASQPSDNAVADGVLAGKQSETVLSLDGVGSDHHADVTAQNVSATANEGTTEPKPPHTPLAGSDAAQAETQARMAAESSAARQKASAAAPESPATEERGDGAPSHAAESTIRVNVHLLDKVMNLVGELVLVRNQILQFSTGIEDSTLAGAAQRLNLITTELQEGIMKTRMQPIGNIWNKFPRVVRDLALACGKRVRLEMEGQETELDKTLIEAIRDPLTHIVRNAVDHGIEIPGERLAAGKPAEGRVLLRAFHESGQVIIEVVEDGAGIDLERVTAKAVERGLISAEQAPRMSDDEIIKLIFLPGFSTARNVTHISGRGVGMDVVKTNIEKIGGTVDVHSRRGEGTTLRVKIPLTLAIIPALVVTCAGDRYAIPQVSLIELVRLDNDEAGKKIETIRGATVYRLRGNLLPLVYLSQVLKLNGHSPQSDAHQAAHIVVLQVGERQFGLVVDEVNDTEEIVVKPLVKQLKGIATFAGATIMGDGKVALILDCLGVAQLSGVFAESGVAARAEDQKAETRGIGDRQRLLLFRAAGSERLAILSSLVARLEEFPRSQIEHAAGGQVVRYRGQILPLVELGPILGGISSAPENDNQPLQVLVVADGDRTVGLLVDQILDIAEEQVTATQLTDRPGLLCSAIVGQKVTDFLDLSAVIQASKQTGLSNQPSSGSKPATVLLVEDQMFSRGLLRSYLEVAGYSVVEAGEATDACEKLARNHFDLVATSLDLPAGGAFKVLEHLCNGGGKPRLPALALIRTEEQRPLPNGHAQFDDYQLKFDRHTIIRSIETLLGPRHALPHAQIESQPEAVMEA